MSRPGWGWVWATKVAIGVPCNDRAPWTSCRDGLFPVATGHTDQAHNRACERTTGLCALDRNAQPPVMIGFGVATWLGLGLGDQGCDGVPCRNRVLWTLGRDIETVS